ncbi:MAG: hypothetical protein AVDCRST_MAG56-1123 [uncultured Cytophagales bacterium]|uniref:Uncharacterized protein n=1 Tax=uncultured Cytophagales bacterium TaxID=158755 RepID=A0A6J4HYF4_9SPHI|nr:MAG: hypothetical protein AVDCRST_MAG56-1123 [uncultured Cytophagales bacterium]
MVLFSDKPTGASPGYPPGQNKTRLMERISRVFGPCRLQFVNVAVRKVV